MMSHFGRDLPMTNSLVGGGSAGGYYHHHHPHHIHPSASMVISSDPYPMRLSTSSHNRVSHDWARPQSHHTLGNSVPSSLDTVVGMAHPYRSRFRTSDLWIDAGNIAPRMPAINDGRTQGVTPPQSTPMFLDSTPANAFRRTPGARRPSSMTENDAAGGQFMYSGLHPRPLFAGPPIIENCSGESPASGGIVPRGLGIAQGEGLNLSRRMTVGTGRGAQEEDVDAASTGASMCESEAEGSHGEMKGVCLIVSNLDYNIGTHEWKKILTNEFQQHVQLLAIHVRMQPDNTSVGFVRVMTMENARYAISHFHRKKIGYKRIHVSLVADDNNESSLDSNMAIIRSDVTSLLMDATDHKLPLYKFLELYEQRFQRTISVAELLQHKDFVEILDQPGVTEFGGSGCGRIVSLRQPSGDTSSSSLNLTSFCDGEDVGSSRGDVYLTARKSTVSVESSVCHIHRHRFKSNSDNPDGEIVLHINGVQLHTLSAQVHKLLQSHDGTISLSSDGAGVALEHLITCVPGVRLSATCQGGVKWIQWAENRCQSPFDRARCPSGASSEGTTSQSMSNFAHELPELLKNIPKCRLTLTQFSAAYQQQFGTQFRTTEYGCTTLMELFDAIPHVAQVVGRGSGQYVTLSHRAQIRRFTADILRVLKSQISRQINLTDLPATYSKVIGRSFDITEYGLCYVEDMLAELPDSTIIMSGSGSTMILSTPKRDQTTEESERTKHFAVEAVDLIRQNPRCRMPFSRFIPAYHHHYGRQCRVADYGFTKLIELFEAIPNVIKIIDDQEEKQLSLSDEEMIHILEDKVSSLLRSFPPDHQIPVPDFLAAYSRIHGHVLQLSDYGAKSVIELIAKIPSIAKVDNIEGRLIVTLVDSAHIQALVRNVLLMLFDLSDDGSMTLTELRSSYRRLFGRVIDTAGKELAADLDTYVQITPTGDDRGAIIRLAPLQMFARDVRTLLLLHAGRLDLNQFETAYAHHFGVGLIPASYGSYKSVVALLQAVTHVVLLRGRGYQHMVLLSIHFQAKLTNPASGKVEGRKVGVGVGSTSFAAASGANKTTGAGTAAAMFVEQKDNSPSADSGYTDPRDDDDDDMRTMNGDGSPSDVMSGTVPSSAVSSPELPWPPKPVAQQYDYRSSSSRDLLRVPSDEKRRPISPMGRTPISDLLQLAAKLLPSSESTRMSSSDLSLSTRRTAANQQVSESPLNCSFTNDYSRQRTLTSELRHDFAFNSGSNSHYTALATPMRNTTNSRIAAAIPKIATQTEPHVDEMYGRIPTASKTAGKHPDIMPVSDKFNGSGLYPGNDKGWLLGGGNWRVDHNPNANYLPMSKKLEARTDVVQQQVRSRMAEQQNRDSLAELHGSVKQVDSFNRHALLSSFSVESQPVRCDPMQNSWDYYKPTPSVESSQPNRSYPPIPAMAPHVSALQEQMKHDATAATAANVQRTKSAINVDLQAQTTRVDSTKISNFTESLQMDELLQRLDALSTHVFNNPTQGELLPTVIRRASVSNGSISSINQNKSSLSNQILNQTFDSPLALSMTSSSVASFQSSALSPSTSFTEKSKHSRLAARFGFQPMSLLPSYENTTN